VRRRVIVLVAGFAVVLPLAWTTPAQAAFVTDNLQVQVTGNPLTNITANPASLIPAFAQGTHDYYVGCQPNVNTLTFQLTGSGSITVGSQTGSSVAVTEGMVESEALVVQTPDPVTPATTTQYWIRCLPHDFPPLAVTKTFSAPAAPGYYLTGTFTSGASGKSAPYAMILDQNGVPVWYQKTPSGAVNVELLPNETDTLAWIRSETLGLNPTASFELHNLDTQAVSHVQAVQGPTDPHELLETATGDRWLIGTPVIPYDLSSSPWSTTAAIFDCVVQELDASGNEVFSWTASQHINLSEAADASPNLGSVLAVNGTSAADIYHCNSVDVDSSGNLLVSMRDTDAVYLVAGPGSATPGKIVWKLGGTTSNLGPDSEDTLTFVNDPETPSSGPNSTISGQHDARFQPNGEISLYDDHTLGTGVGRGVEYAIDPVGMTATFVYQVPGTQPSSATGSFRRYADQNGVYGNDNLVDWGLVGLPGFTEVDGAQPTPKVLFG
jgi:hypothetical protein